VASGIEASCIRPRDVPIDESVVLCCVWGSVLVKGSGCMVRVESGVAGLGAIRMCVLVGVDDFVESIGRGAEYSMPSRSDVVCELLAVWSESCLVFAKSSPAGNPFGSFD
jgi:hypothetical protein